jgi:peptidoglycan/xylan/chitin deacetylase (PgdA/CDA1 family)
MDDGFTALRDRPEPGPSGAMPRARTRPRVEPHHRRRRALALAVLAGIALIAGAATGAGGGTTTHHGAVPTHGYFGRLATLAGTGPGSFAVAERVAENAAINRTLAYTPYVRVAGAQHKELALTFDDGPGPYTPQVLSVLRREQVPGTFFEVGVSLHYFHAGTSEIVADGYPIGDHTLDHAAMSHLSPSGQQNQLLQQSKLIARYGAPFPRLFRPPYGLWDNETLAILRKYRMLMVMWTVDTSDYREPGVKAIVHTAVSGARPGAIILMHDAGGNRSETVAALPRIIRALRARGYKLVTVPKLLLDNPAPKDQQILSILGSGG